jgi:hypothetical protein
MLDMKIHNVFVILILAATSGRCFADDPAPTVDEVLSKWEAASKKCQSFDSKVVRCRYDGVFSNNDKPDVSHGRFYYEAPNAMRFELWKGKTQPTNDWSNVSEAYVWKGDETLCIGGSRIGLDRRMIEVMLPARCTRISWPTGWKPLEKTPSKSGWGLFDFDFSGLRRLAHDPREVFPVVVEINAAVIRDRYTLSLESRKAGFSAYRRAESTL